MNIFGIDIGSSSVKIALIEKKFRGWEVKSRLALDAGIEGGAAQAVRKGLASLNFDVAEDYVAAAFPADKIASRLIPLPFAKRRQIADALPFEMEAQSPFSAEEFVCAHSTVEPKGVGTLVWGALALKRDIEPFIETLKSAGADPDYIIPAPSAVAASSLSGPGGTWRMALEIGHANVHIAVVKNGAVFYSHSAPIGAESLLENIGEDYGAFPDLSLDEWEPAVKKFAKELAREIKMTIKAAAKEDPGFTILGDVSVCGGLGGKAPILKALGEELGVIVVKASMPQGGDGRAEAEGKAPVFAGALGAAIAAAELMDDREKGVPNFRSGEFARKRKLGGDRRQLVVTGVLAAILLAVFAVSYAAEEIRLSRKYDALKNELRAEFKRAMPEVTTIVSEIQQMQSNMKDMENKAASLGFALAEKDPFLDRLGDITKAAPDNARIDVDEFTCEWGKTTLAGRTDNYESVELFKKKLGALPWVKKITTEGAKAAPAGQSVEFRMSLATD